MTQIRITTLENGLRVVSDRMESVETVSVGVWIEAGSRFEAPSVSGVSHLLEHMVFKGTHRRDARAIAEEIEAVGGHINAHTSREYTAFYAKVLKDDVALAVDVISDFLQEPTLDVDELSRERTVVIQEIMQSLDTPDDIIFDRFQETALPNQPLGRPVLGSADRIGDMSREDLMGYMRTHYGAPRMVLSAAGNIDHDLLVRLARASFDRLPILSVPDRNDAVYRGGEWREERDLEQVHLVLGFHGLGYRHPDFYAQSVLSTLLGGGMSSRLFQEIREKRGLVYSIYTFPSSYTDIGLFGIYAGTGADAVEELIPLVCEEVRSVTQGITETEIARARAQIRAGILMSQESTSSRCEQLARQMMVFGRPIPTTEIINKISAITVDDVTSVAGKLFASPLTMAALGPLDGVPAYSTVVDRLAG